MELRNRKERPLFDPLDDARHYIIKGEDQSGLMSQYIDEEIGYGVFTTRQFKKRDFLLQYKGDLISFKEGVERERSYPLHKGSFLYYFRDENVKKCIDATESTGLGRLVNDNHLTPNSRMAVVVLQKQPHLCLFATCDIAKNTEIRFDYGIRSLPWRRKETLLKRKLNEEKNRPILAAKKRRRCMRNNTTDTQQKLHPSLTALSFCGLQTPSHSVDAAGHSHNEETSSHSLDDVAAGHSHNDEVSNEDEFEEQARSATISMAQSSTLATETHSTDHNNPTLDHESIASSDTEGVCADRNAYLMLLDISHGIIDNEEEDLPKEIGDTSVGGHVLQSSHSEGDVNTGVTSDTSRQLETEVPITQEGEHIVQSSVDSDNEDDDPSYSLPYSASNGYDSDSSEEFSLHPKASSRSSRFLSLDVSPKASTLPASSLECSSSAVASLSHVQENITNDISDTCSSSEGEKTSNEASNSDSQTVSAAGSSRYSKPYRDVSDTGSSSEGEKTSNEASNSDSQTVSAAGSSRYSKPYRDVSDTGSSSEGEMTSNEASNSDSQTVSAAGSSSYSKPYRLCIFCDSFKSKLAQHIATQHAEIERVSKALQLPKVQRLKVFDSFRKEGILKVNKQQAKEPKPSYHRERASKRKSPLVMCNICSGFYSKYYLKRHSTLCQGRSESSPTVLPVPLELLAFEREYNTNFFQDILCRFRRDPVGKLCTSDPWLIKVGKRLWEKQRSKVNKKTEVRKSVMTDMRRLASLYMEMMKAEEELGKLPAKEGTISDVFKRANFSHLEIAINSYTSSESTEPNSVKAGLKLSLYYLLKSTAKIVKATYLIEDKDDLSDDVDKFVSVLELNNNFVFGDATYKINQQRQIKLRKPEALPLEDDVRHLREFTVKRMEQITKDELEFWDSHRYVELRDLVVCRLTLFNARRGGEPCRLLLNEWDDAENNVWLDEQHLEALDSLDRALVNEFKIAYQSGKGNKHLVPVLFPKDTLESVRKLRNVDLRSTATVDSNNIFLFPTINGSENHVSGWHAVRSVCDKVDLTNKDTLTATKNRHRLSTMFALMDVPESERQYIYRHMGHSEETNQHIYQAPLAVKELTVVGKRLQTIDEGTGSIPSSSQMSAKSSNGQTSAKCCEASPVVSDAMAETDDRSEDEPQEADVFKGGRRYCKWKKEETTVVRKYFHKYFLGTEQKRLPGRKEILAFLEKSKLKKDWKTVHTKVMNELKKAKSTAVQREREWEEL